MTVQAVDTPRIVEINHDSLQRFSDCKAELPIDAVDRQVDLNLLRRCYCTVSRPAWFSHDHLRYAFLSVGYLPTPQRPINGPRRQISGSHHGSPRFARPARLLVD